MSYYILFTLLVAIIIASFVVLKIFRKKADYERTLNLTFLKITLPKKNSDLDEKKETTKDFKEMIGLMEQLFSSLKSVYSRKILRKIL
jgi:hypothetical protein